jgi:hypothetical protein
VARFDRAVPPGGEGSITLRVTTAGLTGPLYKGARVFTNDPKHQIVRLGIRANIKSPVYLSPRGVRLYGKEDQIITQVVEVKAGLEKPLELTPSRFNLEENLTYTIEEVEKGKRYLIRFKTIPGPPQAFRGMLRLKTNYPEKPVITIKIRGRILKQG